jgi:acyl-CoA dehydrogenase
MNEQQQLIKETLHRLLSDHATPRVIDAAENGQWPDALWGALADTGLALAGISISAGGSGGDLEDSLLVIREAARFAAPVPLAEHFMAALVLQEAGAQVSNNPMTIASGNFELSNDLRLQGSATNVAFARWCDEIIVLAQSNDGLKICRAPRADVTLTDNSNMAGEPRDGLQCDLVLDAANVFSAPEDILARVNLMGAATRCLMMSGSLESILELSVQYSLERTQFGRPISKFQAIQQQLAILAGEVAASTMAAHAVSASFKDLDEVDIAIGKSRIGEAVSSGTDIAHQVHGAMGYTLEHTLNHRTRRLWCWRDEYGNERDWQLVVGRNMTSQAADNGADSLWGKVTDRR